MSRTLLFLTLLCIPAHAQDKTTRKPSGKILAIKGAKVYSVQAAAMENAVILVKNGKILDIGPDVKIPPDAMVADFTGKVIVPGLVDAASRLYLDPSTPMTSGSAEFDVYDELDPFRKEAREAIRNGVTTVCVMPISSGLIEGLTAVVKLGRGPRTWILRRWAALRLSMGSGTSDSSDAVRRYGRYKSLRAQFSAAKKYKEAWAKYRKDHAAYLKKKKEWDQKQKASVGKKGPKKKPDPAPKKPRKPTRNRRYDIMARAFLAKSMLTIRFEVHHADSIEWALKLIKEFKLKAILDQGTEAARVSDKIAASKVPVLVGPVFQYGIPRVDYLRHTPGCAAALKNAGVTVGIASFPSAGAGHYGVGASRFLMDAAAFASQWGLRREQALRMITLEPAKMLGLDSRVGSLAKGKDADLVVLSGEPFHIESRVEMTMIDGRWAFNGKRK